MANDKFVCNTNSVENGEKGSDNNDNLNINVETASVSSVDNFPCPEFQFNTTACYICNGYYGPCFGEPVCVTCHAFLFPNDFGLVQVPIFSEKTDDEDSGNDEPTDLYYSAERRASLQPPHIIPYSMEHTRRSPHLLPYNIEHVRNPPYPLDFAASRPFIRYALHDLENDYFFEEFNNVPFQNNLAWNNVLQNPPNLVRNRQAALFQIGEQRNINFADQDLEEDFPPNPADALPQVDNELNVENPPEQVEPNLDYRLRAQEEHSQPSSLSERINILSDHTHPEHEPATETGLVERLPPEVLLAVFSHLDDVSLWSAVNVCRRWCGLLLTHITLEQWRKHVIMRWPLYSPLKQVVDWYKVYDHLASSAPCRTCLAQTSFRTRMPIMEETSWRKNRLRIELKSLQGDPPEGIKATPLDEMCCHWQATITGPVGSPYEGGLFFLYLQVPHSYPMCPPVVRFLTKILHPNVSRHGDVGIDSIHHNWSLALTISKVLISVQSLLTDPYCQVCMEPELGDMYMNDRDKFEEVARAWTWKYAMNDVIIPS